MSEQIKQPLSEKAAGSLLDYIVKNRLEPGKRLPNEHMLADMLKVGRGTVREAVKLLESQGIVSVRHGAGIFVAGHSKLPGISWELKAVAGLLDVDLDLAQICTLLEPELAAMAAENATDEEMDKLERLCLELEECIETEGNGKMGLNGGGGYKNGDLAFHIQIAVCSGNKAAASLVAAMEEGMGPIFEDPGYSVLRRTVLEHRELVRAIRNRKSWEAKEIMLFHVLGNKRELEKKVQKEKSK